MGGVSSGSLDGGSVGLAGIHDTLDKPWAGSAEGWDGWVARGNATPVSGTVLPVRSPWGTCPAKTRAAAATGPVLPFPVAWRPVGRS